MFGMFGMVDVIRNSHDAVEREYPSYVDRITIARIQSAFKRQYTHNSSSIVGLGRIRRQLRLPRPVCLKTTGIRNLLQSGQEVLEIPEKICKFVGIKNRTFQMTVCMFSFWYRQGPGVATNACSACIFVRSLCVRFRGATDS